MFRGKIGKWIVCISLLLLAAGITMQLNTDHSHDAESLRVAFPFYWGNLTPPLQHTAHADIIIKNQFESLVGWGEGSKIEPLAARSWTVSADHRTFTFKIDTTRRFSNGTRLSARHFKEAWEYALTLQPKSANNSLQDLLY